ncbi:MAG: membrane dipeptidase, partial [Holdemanella sp.]|nr:membrane dipeptidase [Holdemanella sp.]
MKVVDMHCDTIYVLLHREEENKDTTSLYKNDLSIDIEKLQQGNYLLQNFALFTDLKYRDIPEMETLCLYDKYCRELDE